MDAFSVQSRIRRVDTDASGIVHYSAIFRHVEAADDELLRALGAPYSEFHRNGIEFPRVHVECDYVRPLKLDDPVQTTVRVERVGTSSFTISFMMETGGEPRARGKLVIVCIDRDGGRARLLPEPLASALRGRLTPSANEEALR